MIFCSVCQLPIIEEAKCSRESCGHTCHERCKEGRTTQPCTECATNEKNAKIRNSISNIDSLLRLEQNQEECRSRGASTATPCAPTTPSPCPVPSLPPPSCPQEGIQTNVTKTVSSDSRGSRGSKTSKSIFQCMVGAINNSNNSNNSNQVHNPYDEPWWLLEAIIFCVLGSFMLWVLFEFEH